MPEVLLPRYPIYVPSKGRARSSQTARFLVRDGVPFRFVVEAPEAEEYRERWPGVEVLVMPTVDEGIVVARNWCMEHAIEEGWDRHWQLDDNINDIRRLWKGKRIPMMAGVALRLCEDFTERYENVAISGLNYQMFVTDTCNVPFYLNCHVYSCCLFDNRLPYRWRYRINEDTDLCLQVLASGYYCTVALNAFHAHKQQTMKSKGGNTDNFQYFNDGRVKMARALQRQWPYVVSVNRRFRRPQHVVRDAWRGFDQPLIRRADIDWENLPAVDEFGLRLTQKAETITSPTIRRIYEDTIAASGS